MPRGHVVPSDICCPSVIGLHPASPSVIGLHPTGSLSGAGSPGDMPPCKQEPPPSVPDHLSTEEWNYRILVVLAEFLGSPGVDSLSVRDELRRWKGRVGGEAGESPDWLHQYQQQVEKAVRLHFPSPPPECSPQQQPELDTYLGRVKKVVQGELLRLAPVLKEAGLLGTLIDRYHVHTMSQLEQLLQSNLYMDQIFTLLRWTLKTYLSTVLGHPDVSADVFAVMDMMLLADWLKKAKTKALQSAQEYVGGCLKRMLEREEEEEEEAGSCDQSDEEAFIRLHLDITQCLTGIVRKAGVISPSFRKETQMMCLFQLHTFLHRFTAREKKRMTGGKGEGEERIPHLFRTINTCIELRLLAMQLASEAQTDGAATVGLLEELETQARHKLLDTAAHNLEVSLQMYFKRKNTHMGKMLSDLKLLLKKLPKECRAHTVVMDALYGQVVSLYLKQLLLSNHRHLQRSWGHIGQQIEGDAEELHKVFSQQNKDLQKRSMLLLKVADVLSLTDEDALKLTCSVLLSDFPQVSREQVKKLLRWRGDLSQRQVKAVLDTTSDMYDVFQQSPRRRPLTLWWCWACI
ncbi:hypothetical protein ACEWY4_005841 [Coilia grayii]|uniref:Uncharacterized protein n=1 Tax=Coilia grayii TaxID=363190 RepID=A0ABD1KK37_9TELE